jgi:hypothetical protein
VVHIDWDAGHGPVAGPINATWTSLTLAWADYELAHHHLAHLGPGWLAGAAGAGLVGSMYAGRKKRIPRSALIMRAATWLGVGGWCSWATVEGPWTGKAIGALIAGGIGLGAAIEGARHHEEVKADERARFEAIERAASMDAKRRAVADEWTERLTRVCTSATVQIVGVEQWESGGGFTLDGECSNGTKWRDFKAFEDGLAADAKLPEGCGVEVGPGAHRGAVLINVATVNRLAGDEPYPADYSPLSLNDGLPMGVYRDGARVAPSLRQLSTLMAGRKGSGKTNLSNVEVAGLVRMTDNITWVIDLNGGGLALAWLHAWEKAGRPGKPPIDWVADTPAKALAMAKAALRIAKARKPGYKHLELEANDDKLPVCAAVPGIMIVGDEIAEIFSPKARKNEILKETGDTLIQVVELARAVAVNALITALRATQDVISEPQLLAQSGLKIGMKSDEREMSYLFGWSDRISTDDAPYPGCGFVKILDEPARPFKAYRMLPNQIADIVKATSDRHPDLDDLSRKAAGDAYEKRWENTDHLFGLGSAPFPVEEGLTSIVGDRPERRRSVTADWGKPEAGPLAPEAQSVIDQADAAKRDLHQTMDENASRDADLERQFRDIVEGAGGVWTPPTDDTPAPAASPNSPTPGISSDDRWPQVYGIVRSSGPEGINPEGILDTFRAVFPNAKAPSRQTVTTWLKAEPKIVQPGGERTNYIHTDHIQEQ